MELQDPSVEAPMAYTVGGSLVPGATKIITKIASASHVTAFKFAINLLLENKATWQPCFCFSTSWCFAEPRKHAKGTLSSVYFSTSVLSGVWQEGAEWPRLLQTCYQVYFLSNTLWLNQEVSWLPHLQHGSSISGLCQRCSWDTCEKVEDNCWGRGWKSNWKEVFLMMWALTDTLRLVYSHQP